MTKKKLFVKISVLTVFMALCVDSALISSAALISAGRTIPAFTLNAPDSPAARAYLGLRKEKNFTLSQIKANFFILEFFDVY
jgi:hypothetical protein